MTNKLTEDGVPVLRLKQIRTQQGAGCEDDLLTYARLLRHLRGGNVGFDRAVARRLGE